MQRILSFFSRQVAGLEVAAREAAARERALHDKCSEEGQARARIETDFAAAAVTSAPPPTPSFGELNDFGQ